jgi:2Fe-2S ferredoxin
MKIKVLPQGIEFDVNSNQTLLEQCLANGIKIRSVCKGIPSCAECRIQVVEGMSNILSPTQAELNLVGTNYYLDGRRLSCQCRVFGPVTINVSDHLDSKDESLKKVRGIPHEKLKQSHAVIRTLVLDDDSTSDEKKD